MFITDPWFYAIAVPAVLLMGVSMSGFLIGFGSMATPMMALALPVPQAAAIMLPLLLGTVVGTLLFGLLSDKTVAAVVGALALAFLAQRLLFPPRRDAPPPPRAIGFVLGVAGGVTSFVAHAGGPPLSAYVLPLRLAPVRLVATMAVLFGAINLSKWIPYAWLGLLDGRNLLTSLALLPLAPLGVWLGVWATRRIDAGWFYRVAYTGMALTGAKLLWDGLR